MKKIYVRNDKVKTGDLAYGSGPYKNVLMLVINDCLDKTVSKASQTSLCFSCVSKSTLIMAHRWLVPISDKYKK